jgi:PEP-CTERM motif
MKEINKALAREWVRQCALVAALLAMSVTQSEAQTYNLSARNTSLQIDASGGTPGISDWTINGVNQLDQQWFYLSVNSSPVQSIDNFGTWSFGSQTPGNSPGLTGTYTDSGVASVQTTYTLSSHPVGSGIASLGTQISVQNLSALPETIQLFQYSDFWLGGVPGGQNVQFTPGSPNYYVTQTGGGGPLIGTLSATSQGTNAIVGEAASLYNGGSQLAGIISGNPSPAFDNSQLSAGTGNVTYGYVFDATVAAGQTLSISEIQTVPEPSPLALLALGILGAGLLHRYKSASFKKAENELY